ncbi:MAG: glycosyltransferase family 2 protein [Nitrospirae bacterium]|nr:glycosyltransferase family 2 protein [Nitrospirota bacterium]MBF0534447.1 glycosyltransferase family 2 protein [Nitrospirota bacterium]MBF0617073.1 glycosyltransferase family 2 protein [Nitrospirota bacterium]
MPCLNEAETLGICVEKAMGFIKRSGISAEVLVADNGSTDGSKEIAISHGATVIDIKERGYGAALMGGIAQANGKYVIMGDCDDSYDFTNLEPFVEKLREGYELVMGNRFKGGIKKGAMPPLHRYFGNPFLSGLGRLFFRSPVRDFQCGLRGFNKESIEKINLQTPGMEFASEMVVKATLFKLKLTEVPTTLSPDGRSRAPHLRSFRDGWRYLRFLLIFSPRWLFLYPGILMIFIGTLLNALIMRGPMPFLGANLDIHTMLYASAAIIIGVQSVVFALFSKVFAINSKLVPDNDRFIEIVKSFTLEKGIILGMLLTLIGLVSSVYAVELWSKAAFGKLNAAMMMRITIPAVTTLTVGILIIISSFYLSILGLKSDIETQQSLKKWPKK